MASTYRRLAWRFCLLGAQAHVSIASDGVALLPSWMQSSNCPEASSPLSVAECLLRDAYPEKVDGKGAAVDTHGSDLRPLALQQLLEVLPGGDLSKGDVFFGLGPGGAKAAMQVFLTTPAQESVSVEKESPQHALAVEALSSLLERGLRPGAGGDLSTWDTEARLAVQGKELKVLHADPLASGLENATVVLVGAKEYADGVALQLRPGTIVAFRAKLEGCPSGLWQTSRIVDESGKAVAFAYLVAPSEAAVVEILSRQEAAREEISRSAAGQRLRRLRSGVLGRKGRKLEEHRAQGSVASEVHCDALELLTALGRGEHHANVVLAVTDLLRTDHNSFDVLRYVLEEQRLALIEKWPQEKLKQLMGLVGRIVTQKTRVLSFEERPSRSPGNPLLKPLQDHGAEM